MNKKMSHLLPAAAISNTLCAFFQQSPLVHHKADITLHICPWQIVHPVPVGLWVGWCGTDVVSLTVTRTASKEAPGSSVSPKAVCCRNNLLSGSQNPPKAECGSQTWPLLKAVLCLCTDFGTNWAKPPWQHWDSGGGCSRRTGSRALVGADMHSLKVCCHLWPPHC